MPDTTPAVAEGWRVAALRGQVYPALVPSTGNAAGTLFTGLTPAEWQLLDAFEDTVYELRQLDVDNGRCGWAYVCVDEAAVLPETWDMVRFERDELGAYVERCGTWRGWWEAGQS
jgi:gamma-glutamylcyclotransferase (GGCT)/AIG2-like uncharacterized protein YtfP